MFAKYVRTYASMKTIQRFSAKKMLMIVSKKAIDSVVSK